jgi:hypothetical protein
MMFKPNQALAEDQDHARKIQDGVVAGEAGGVETLKEKFST